jgi:hypothetical protein
MSVAVTRSVNVVMTAGEREKAITARVAARRAGGARHPARADGVRVDGGSRSCPSVRLTVPSRPPPGTR